MKKFSDLRIGDTVYIYDEDYGLLFKPIKAIKHEHGHLCISIKDYPNGIHVCKYKSYAAYDSLSIACDKISFY